MSEIVELLEAYVELAKKDTYSHFAVVMVKYPNIAAADYAGDIALDASCVEALQGLQRRIQGVIEARTLPRQDRRLGRDYIVYNVTTDSLGFDFTVWLLTGEINRRREGAPAPLKVAFWLGKDNSQVNPERQAWLDNVFRPALKLIGAVEDPEAVRGYHHECFTTKELVTSARAGESIPHFSAPNKMAVDAAPVVITLREAEHWKHRNSNLRDWVDFAAWLRDQGERVIFIRDTAKAAEPLPDFGYPPFAVHITAARDLQVRMALYEVAKANLFVANGPATLCQFSAAPWLMFVPVEDEKTPGAFLPNTPKYLEAMGIPVGSQFPWSAPNQRIIWKADTYPAMVEAWTEHFDAKGS